MLETITEDFVLDELIVDADGKPSEIRFLAVNPAFNTQTGLKAGDIVRRTALDLFPDAAPLEWRGTLIVSMVRWTFIGIGLTPVINQPLSVVEMPAVYIGILLAAAFLLVVGAALYLAAKKYLAPANEQ